MVSLIGQMIVSLSPLLIFLALYLGFYIWGHFANKKKKEKLLDDVLTAVDPYILNHVRKDPNDRQIELRLQLKDDFKVKSASAWLILLPRTSFPTMFVDKLFFHNKDAFGLAANFQEKPRVVFEVIPYRMKSAIRKDFDYLIEIDDIIIKENDIDNKFLIKSNKSTVINQYVRSDMFKNILKKYGSEIQWISVRTDSPHFEMKFNFPKDTTDFIALVKFCMASLKFFGKVTEKTKHLPVPAIVPPKKLSEKEKQKQEKEREKEREKMLKEKRRQQEKERKEREKNKKKQKSGKANRSNSDTVLVKKKSSSKKKKK